MATPHTTVGVPFKGTDTVGSLLAEFGKVKVNLTKPFALVFESVQSTLASVKVAASPTGEEKAAALACLTAAERVQLAALSERVSSEAKRLAALRVAGATAERWTTRGETRLA